GGGGGRGGGGGGGWRGGEGERGGEDVGVDVGEYVPPVTVSGGPRGVDIGHLADGESARADHTGTPRDDGNSDGDDDVYRTRAEDGDDSERQDDQREGHQHVHDAL